MDLSNENVVHIKSNGIEYLQFRKLLEYPEIKYAYVIGLDKSFKIYSNPINEEKQKNILAENSYKKICEELNLNYNNVVNTNQNHTDNIKIIDEKINEDEPDFNIYEDTDGLITNKKEIILSTINADCILLVFYDPVKKVIANVHSGWKGTVKRISVKTVEKMKKEFGCNPKDLICCMSPSIGKDHFEVDEDVYDIFKNEFKDIENKNNDIYEHITKGEEENKINFQKNKWHIDTILINRLILEYAGLKKENIIDSGICSVCNKDIIHSYRAHGLNSGRATQIIVLN